MRNVLFLEPVFAERVPGEGKTCGHFSLVASMTDNVRAGPATGDEHQCINQNGLTCARFASERSHARFELQLDVINDGKVLYLDAAQHRYASSSLSSGLSAPRPQCSLERSIR